MKTTGKRVTWLECLSLEDVYRILIRRVHWILLVTTLVFGAVVIVVWHWPDKYKAQTLILVDPQKVPERYVAPTVSADVGNRLNTINQEVMSSTNLQRVIDTYRLYKNQSGMTQEEIIDQMRKDISVEVVRNFEAGSRGLGAFRIIYQGRSPEMVAQVCNQLASMIIDQNLKVREQQAEGTSEFIDAQLGAAKQKLEEQEQRLRDFKLQHVGELPEQATANMATLSRLQTQLQAETEALNRARQQEVYLQSLLASYTSQSDSVPLGTGSVAASTWIAPSAAPVSPELLRSRQERVLLTEKLRQLSTRYHDTHPDIQQAKAMLQALDEQIEIQEKSLAATASAQPRKEMSGDPGRAASNPAAVKGSADAGLRGQLTLIQTEIQNRQATQERISAQIRGYQAKLDNMPVREQQIVGVARGYEISKGFYQSLLDKKMAADMAADLEKRQKSERFTVLDPARVPEKPFKPNRPAIGIIGLMAGLALGFGFAFLLELRDDSLRKEVEVAFAGLRVLARIPELTTLQEARTKRLRAVKYWLLGAAAAVATLVMVNFLTVLVVRKTAFLVF